MSLRDMALQDDRLTVMVNTSLFKCIQKVDFNIYQAS